MRYKILKQTLFGLALLVGLFILLMLTPRIWSALHPGKPPVGYFFLPPTYLAVYTGIESQADKPLSIPAHIETIRDVEYKQIHGKSLRMDFYHAKSSPQNLPLLVFIHGGAWSHGDGSEYLGYALYFANLGYATVTLTYRFVKDAPYPACVEDVTDAVQFLFEHGEQYRYDPDKIVLIGGSAGAHLAMLAAYGWKSSATKPATTDTLNHMPARHKIKAVAELYGPVDFTTEYARNQSMVTRLIAHSYEETPQLYAEASPLSWVSKEAPPTLILHGTSDNLVPIGQAEQLKYKLDSLGVPSVYLPLPGWPHTTDLVKRVSDYFKVAMGDFFEKYVSN